MPKIWHKELTGLGICILSGKSKGTKEGSLEEKSNKMKMILSRNYFSKSL